MSSCVVGDERCAGDEACIIDVAGKALRAAKGSEIGLLTFVKAKRMELAAR